MSSAQNLPKRTQILIKDLPFQEKYQLSHSQTDLMAYLVNVTYWAINVEGYFVIATSKIMEDLPTMGKKTIEASFKVLKELELIICKTVKVTQWQRKPKLRGIQLTQKGKEYNKNLILPSQDERVKALEKENRELKETISKLMLSESEPSTPKEEIIKKPSIPTMPTPKKSEPFIAEVIKFFGRSSEPICNAVPSWNRESTFYINSYNKLSLVTPENKYIQLKDPIQINKFWEWLFNHPNRVGDKIDFNKSPTINDLKMRFLDQNIKLNGVVNRVDDIIEVVGGVKLKLQSKNRPSSFVIDTTTKKDMIFTTQKCQDILFELLL